MAKARLPLYRLESKWAIAALIAGLMMAVALWAAWSWNDSRYFVSRNLLHQSRTAHLPLSIMLENAEARLAAVADKPRYIRDGIVFGAADGAAEGIIVAPDIDLVSASLSKPIRQAIANRRDGRPGLSLPFQLDGKWRAILATLDRDNHVLATTIELDRLSSLWTDIGEDAADSIAIATADGQIWWRRPMLEGLVGKDASKGPLFQAIKQSGAMSGVSDIEAINTDGSHRLVGWRYDPKHQLYVTFSQPHSAVLACWLGRFPFSLAIAIVLVLAASIMAVRASRSDRERARAKKLAAESEQRLADWARASADVFWETDAEHRLTHIRAVGEELEEGALDGLFGKTRWQLARVQVPEDHPEWQPHIVDLEARRPFKNFEYGIDTKTNGTVWVRCSGSPMFTPSGKFLGYRGVTSDINKERQGELELAASRAAVAASEQLLRAVIDQLPATVSVKDPNGRLLIYNKRFAQVFNLEQDSDGVGKRMADAIPTDMGRAIDARDRLVLETGKPLELERPAGDYILHIMKYPQLNEAGESIGLVTVGYDITERRRAEQRLAASERRLAHMVELLPAGAVYVENGQMTINAYVEEMTGRSRDELTSLDDWFRLVPVRPEIPARETYEEEVRTGFSRSLSFPIRKPDGSIRQVEWAGYRADEAEVWLLRDVTDSFEAEARFKALFERSTTGHLIVRESVIVDCNAAALSLIGAAQKEQIIGLHMDAISPEYQPDGALSAERVRENATIIRLDGSTRFEWRHTRLDGSPLDVQVSSTRIAYGDQPAALIEWHDIADRKAYELKLLRGQELIERERGLAVERMNDTTQALSGWIWETDAEHRFVFMTESVERMAGVKPEWHYGKTRRDLMAAGVQAVRSELDEVERAMFAHEPFRDFEFIRTGPDGNDGWLRTSGVPFFDDNGEFLGYRGAAFSIDYEKQLEGERARLMEEAAAARRRLEQAIDAQTNSFALFDADDRLVACNKAFSEMSPLDGYRLQIGEQFEKIPSSIADYRKLTGKERKAFIDKRMFEHLNDIGPITKQTTRNRWIISDERRTSEGGVVGVWTDVTELIEARQAAEAANRAKSEFLAMISHEIRTPMNAVLGMASVLLESEMQAEQRRQVETIKNSGEALLTLINDVLDLSKIEARRIELETEEFSLKGLLDAVLDIAGARAAVKQLEVVAYADIGLADRLLGDANRLRQILLNLVSNATKFTEEGSISINARAISQTSTGTTTVRFEVKDTGIGIPAEVLEKLFTPFTQADASTTRRYGGTGLGLTISKQLIELMGGRIGVESAPGEGSCFWVEAPFVPADTAQSIEPPQDTGDWLIIGQDSLTRQMIVKTVEDAGADALIADDAASGLRALDDPSISTKTIGILESADLNVHDLVTVVAKLGHDTERRIVVISKERADTDDLLALPAVDGVVAAPVRSWQLLNPNQDEVADVTIDPPTNDDSGLLAPLDVLLVEDNRVNQMVATAMLKLGNHRVDIAENGLEALSAVLRKKYDVIFMDMQMPQMDGLDATREIRAMDNVASKTPIVAMTANAMVEDRKRCMDAGMDDFLSKPIDHGRLNATLDRWGRQGGVAVDEDATAEELQLAAKPTSENLQVDAFVEDEADRFDSEEAVLRDLVADLDDILGASDDDTGGDPLGGPQTSGSS